MAWTDGDPLGERLRIAPGAALGGDPSTYPWIDVTGDIAQDQTITLETGAADEASETNSQFSWTFRDNFARYDVDNAESDLYGLWDLGCPVEWAINLGDGSGWIVLAIMYVAEIDDAYEDAPNMIRRPIVAAGMFRRLGQGKTLSSTITRNVRSTKAVRYYRLEDGSDARYAVSDVANQPPMTQLNGALPNFANRTGVPGSLAVPQFQAGQTLNVDFPAYKAVGLSLTWQWLINVKALTITNQLVTQRMIGSRISTWFVFQDVGACPRLRAVDSQGNVLYTSSAFTIQTGMVGDGANRPDNHPWWWYHVKLTQTGTQLDIDYRCSSWWIDANGNGQLVQYLLAADTIFGMFLGSPTGWTIAPNGVVEDIAVGHMGLFDSGISSPLNNGTAAVIGWPQSAAARIAGVSNEMSLPNNVTANPTALLGSQQPGTTLQLLRDGAGADHGILDDSLGVVGYRGLYDLYNLTPSITLDGANREIHFPYAPKRDDQRRRNSYTVSRPGGSTATVDDLTDQAKAGFFGSSPSINLGSDADLPHHAQYGVTLGTVPGKRYPAITIDFGIARHLARPWVGMKLGDRFQINNPPRGGSRQSFQLQVRGTTQAWLNRRQWVVTCNTIMADPFNVASLEDSVLGRAEADEGSVTAAADVGVTTATFNVATAAGHPLPIDSTTVPSDFPFYARWDGEKILVRSIVGTTSPQVWTVDRSQNGVHKIHKAGSVISLWTPMRPAF
jgi:hypothetical protein